MFNRLRDGLRASLSNAADPNANIHSGGGSNHPSDASDRDRDSGHNNNNHNNMMMGHPSEMHNLRNPQNLHAARHPSLGGGRGGGEGHGPDNGRGGSSSMRNLHAPSSPQNSYDRLHSSAPSAQRSSFFPPFKSSVSSESHDVPPRHGPVGGRGGDRGAVPPSSRNQPPQGVPPSPHRKHANTRGPYNPNHHHQPMPPPQHPHPSQRINNNNNNQGGPNNNHGRHNTLPPQDRASKSPNPYSLLGGGNNPRGSTLPSPHGGTPLRSMASPSKSPFSAERILSAAAFRGLAAPPFLKPSSSSESDPKSPSSNTATAVGNGPHTDPEFIKEQTQRDSLESQIRHRDQHISKLQHDLHHLQNTHHQMQKDHLLLRRQHLESSHRHIVAIQLWKRTNEGLKARVECFATETTANAAKEIASLIRDAAPPNKDSTYLMTLQDQLSKATVKLDHLANQTEIVLHKGEEVIESLREEMNEVIRERSRMEIELTDQRNVLESEKERMKRGVERRIWRVEKELEFLEKKAVEELGEEGKGMSKSEDELSIGEDEDGDDNNNNNDDGSGKGEADEKDADGSSKKKNEEEEKEEEPTPEQLRLELRKLTLEKDKKMFDLRTNLRKKNEEFHQLLKLKEARERKIRELEKEKFEREREKREREEWARGRDDFHGMGGELADIGLGMDEFGGRFDSISMSGSGEREGG